MFSLCLNIFGIGTGKTSLCKAVSQKLAIRLQQRYSQGQLIEINAHSLFSKWFSESGKLVLKLFSKIQEMIEDEDAFICVLIDEVESLTSARKSAMNGNEPSDAIRVVNAVLTQIDKLKQYKNVLILATSNIAQAIDLAFIDRADVKFFIGNPGLQARYQILKSCIDELCRVDIISTTQDNYLSDQFDTQNSSNNNELTNKLIKICESCNGLSGRNLRKLPFLAHTFFIKSPQISLDNYLNALYHAVEKESLLRKKLQEETL